MFKFDLDNFYTLYNEDNGVVIYDSQEAAEATKAKWLKVVPVDGPFKHGRIEKPLILAAHQAVEILRAVCHENQRIAKKHNLDCVAQQLEHALYIALNPSPCHQSHLNSKS
jgi:hypothetical protein